MKPTETIFDYARLRGAIRECCVTEGDYAKAINRSPNYISKVFQGKSNFSSIDIIRSAKVLGIKTDDIGRYFFEIRECCKDRISKET